MENYIENFQYRADSNLISSHHIVKIAVSLPATNFHINNILETPCSKAYPKDYSALYNSDYLERNLVAVCTVQKLDFTDENSRLIFERSGCFTYGENQIDFTYVVLRDESDKWQVINNSTLMTTVLSPSSGKFLLIHMKKLRHIIPSRRKRAKSIQKAALPNHV